MSALTQTKIDHQELGDLLLKVQDELKGLRTRISQDGAKVDLNAIQSSLMKAENELKEKTNTLINQLNSQVKTLPPTDEKESDFSLKIENLLDANRKDRSQQSGTVRSAITFSHDQSIRREDDNHVVLEEIQEIPISMSKVGPVDFKGLTPGQQVKIYRENRALVNPENAKNRTTLNENYNIQLPLIEKRTSCKMSTHLITGSTIEHLATLPLAYRRNPTLVPPPVSESEARYGLLSIIERGLIPPSSKISFEPLPIAAKQIKPNETTTSQKLNERFKEIPSSANAMYRMDPNYRSSENFKEAELNSRQEEKRVLRSKAYLKRRNEAQKLLSMLNKANETSGSKRSNTTNILAIMDKEQSVKVNSPVPLKAITNGNKPLSPPVTPLNAVQVTADKVTHRFVIQNGKTKTDLQEYLSFKQYYCLRWGNIVSIIKLLEDICKTYTIPIGYIDGHRVGELARNMDMDINPTKDQLLSTFINRDEIEKLVKTPGQIFKKKNGQHLAATRIQCAYRRYRDRTAYLEYRRKKWAAGVIALTWLTYVKLAKARENLKLHRAKQLENFKKRLRDFQRNWPRIKTSKRVIIHIPSLGYNLQARANMKDLVLKENAQMSRLCDIIDENVDVIYVTSLPINEETLQYYLKLLGLRSAVETGKPENQTDLSHRYKIVIPEALNKFPTHNMSLSTLLKYSPKALERIQNLIKGREAYILPGVMSHDDLYIADFLNVPIYGPEPEIANLYTTKSGSKRIFQSAKVSIPYGEFDIYNKQQLYECLAQAVTENLYVQRWLFKLDDECDGRGIAYCDVVKHLSCYNWALKEMTKFGDKWSKRWAYEPTYVKILEEIPDILSKFAKPANPEIYANWEIYLKAFLTQGGIIEAHPPSDSITSLTVSMVIEPDLTIKILSSGDHIHADSQYSCWGISFPQTSVDPKQLNEACMKIAESCKQRHIIGYFDIDFVTFIDPKTEQQMLWATDLNISFSDHVAMTSLLFYMSNGKFDPANHAYTVPTIEDPSGRQKRLKAKPEDKSSETGSRYAVMSTKLHHSNLAVIHYSVFFQTCRALGIGYDIREKQGTLFSLVDSINHVNIGMLTVTDNLQTAMSQFAKNLISLHKQISSSNMQGRTNFMLAADDLKKILGLTDENKDEASSNANED